MSEVQNLPAVLTPQQQAWASLPAQKNHITDNLQRMELASQDILNGLNREGVTYQEIDEKLAEYRKNFESMKSLRLPFTSMINEKIVQPMMEPEKRVDYVKNQLYNQLFNKGVDLKIQEKKRADAINGKENEKATFKNHVINEYTRTVGLYRTYIRDEIRKIYESNLTAKIPDPKPAIEGFKQVMAATETPRPNRFMPNYLNEEEMKEIYLSIPAPRWNEYLNEMFKEMDDLFVNYDSALANAEQAIKAKKDEDAIKTLNEKEVQESEMAINTLVSSAETVQIEGPKLKTTLVVKKENSENWGMAVIAAFVANRRDMMKYVKVKEWGNLKIQQMADAVGKYATETGLKPNGIEFEEVIK